MGHIFLLPGESSDFWLNVGYFKSYIIGFLVVLSFYKECWALIWKAFRPFMDKINPLEAYIKYFRVGPKFIFL